MLFGYEIAEVRKGLIAAVGAVVTLCHAFGVPLAEDISVDALAIFDAVVAVLVIAVPNAQP